MVRGDIVFDRRIGHDSPCRCAFGSADDVDREIVLIQILYQFDHGEIESVDISHIVKAVRVFFTEFHGIIIELIYSHPGISLGKVPGKRLICLISRLDFLGCLLQFLRDLIRVIIQTILDEHHRVIVSIEGLAGKCSVHVKYSDAVLDRNEAVCICLIGHLSHIVSEALGGRRISGPICCQSLFIVFRLILLRYAAFCCSTLCRTAVCCNTLCRIRSAACCSFPTHYCKRGNADKKCRCYDNLFNQLRIITHYSSPFQSDLFFIQVILTSSEIPFCRYQV